MAADSDKEMRAWLASLEADRLSDYLRRGRKYASVSSEALSEAWKKAFRASVQFYTSDIMRRERDDLEAELELRDIEPPYADVADVVETFTRMANDAVKELETDPERMHEVEESLQADLETFSRRRDLKN